MQISCRSDLAEDIRGNRSCKTYVSSCEEFVVWKNLESFESLGMNVTSNLCDPADHEEYKEIRLEVFSGFVLKRKWMSWNPRCRI
jgi:hypothetical protein